MKSHATKLLVAAMFVLIGLPSFAQTLKANVPFDFVADNVKVAAGGLMISRMDANHEVLRTAAGKGLLMCRTTVQDRRISHPKLVFQRYGSDYFLAEIWTGERVEKVPAGKQQQRIARSKPADETIAVALTSPMNDKGR